MNSRPTFTDAGKQNTAMHVTFPLIARWPTPAIIFLINGSTRAEILTLNNWVFSGSYKDPHNRSAGFLRALKVTAEHSTI
jgi:hypothetical protein